jgi:hypothetical protein
MCNDIVGVFGPTLKDAAPTHSTVTVIAATIAAVRLFSGACRGTHTGSRVLQSGDARDRRVSVNVARSVADAISRRFWELPSVTSRYRISSGSVGGRFLPSAAVGEGSKLLIR